MNNPNLAQQQIQKAQFVRQLNAERAQLERRMGATREGIGALSGLQWLTTENSQYSPVVLSTYSACQAMCAVQLSQLKLALVEGEERLAQIDANLKILTSPIAAATLLVGNGPGPGHPSA